MKQQIAFGVLAVSMIGGVGTGLLANDLGGNDPMDPNQTTTAGAPATTQTPATTDTPAGTDKVPPAKAVLQPAGSLRILPGQVGPVKVGMSKAEAYATGYLDKDVTRKNCGTVDRLAWKAAYKDSFDIATLDDGEVSAIGVFKPGPRTISGLQIGSTYKAVKDALPADSAPMEAGYSQTGLMVNDGDSWIGFLFNGQPDTIAGDEPVRFIEVTRGRLPSLMRDGC